LILCFSSSAPPSSIIPGPPWQQPGSFEGCYDLQLPSGCRKKPSGYCTCQRHLGEGNSC
jgi:hypothetical protein